MSLEQQADFRITTTWEDNASGPMIASTEKINLAWKRVKDEQRAVQRQFEINNRTLVASQRVIQSVNQVVRVGIQIFQTWTLMQIRAQDATKNLRDANLDLNDVLVEFGPNSKEYLDALQQLKDAEEDLAQTNRDNLVGSLLMISIAIGGVSNAAISAIPRLKQLMAIGRKIKTPSVPSKTSVPTPKTGGGSAGRFGGLGKIGGIAGGIASGAASAGLYLAQLMGEQNVSAPTSADSPDVISDSGLENLKKVAGDIYVTITNMINSPTPDQMNKDITDATQRGLAFKAN